MSTSCVTRTVCFRLSIVILSADGEVNVSGAHSFAAYVYITYRNISKRRPQGQALEASQEAV